MKKRFFATLAAILTLAMALTACGAPASNSGSREVEVLKSSWVSNSSVTP